jgi:hypothetical protein
MQFRKAHMAAIAAAAVVALTRCPGIAPERVSFAAAHSNQEPSGS